MITHVTDCVLSVGVDFRKDIEVSVLVKLERKTINIFQMGVKNSEQFSDNSNKLYNSLSIRVDFLFMCM